ncbi:MAG TPA: ImcF-related family protein [Gemmatimonadaceae bacterium]|nr:ImcF-related family protein [Gemmatimonadaceae bacterium]
MGRKAKIWLIAVALFLVFVIAGWLLGVGLALHGADAWVLGGGLALLGLIAGGAVLWFFLRGTSEAPSAETDDVDSTVAAAISRLAASNVGGATSLRTLPVVMVLGPAGSAKTTTITRSGLEPELLSGAVMQGGAVAPTAGVNLWFAEQTVLFEAGGALMAGGAGWARALHHLQPARLRAALTGSAQAPRVAVVCLSCEEFLQAGASESVPAAARTLRARLADVTRALGVRLPVYVIFTKADRIAHFTEFVQNFSADEAHQVVGATLSASAGDDGVYAERETERLLGAFQRLFQSFAAHRLPVLSRESTGERRLGAYEFPRELRKAAPLMTQFLVELCRPSQLEVSPFLRGFYFAGVRPIIVTDTAPADTAPAARGSKGIAATSVFQAGPPPAAAPSPASPPTSRRIPQWLFLEQLFHEVILRDRVAMGVTSGGTRVNGVRRTLLALGVVVALVVGVGFAISYLGNRRMERGALAAARSVAALSAPVDTALPSVDALHKLDTARAQLITLAGYERDGAPLHLRMGLYTGTALFPATRRIYFRAFDTVMFGATRAAMLNGLRVLPDTPRVSDDYGTAYNLLRGYLITTADPDKSTPEFLTPVLMSAWLGTRPLDSSRTALAKRQFDFYGTALAANNPLPTAPDTAAVQHARQYLLRFAGAERIYQYMLAEAAKNNPPVQFNHRFPGSSAVLVDRYQVPGAFTKGGWTFMQSGFKNVERFFHGDAWVLGEQQGTAVDRAKLLADLRARYQADYIRHWRTYLESAAVVRYANPKDAASKLSILSGNQSPLLALLSLAAQNSPGDTSAVAMTLQPVSVVVPPDSSGKFIGKSNAAYMTALATLQASLDQAANAPPGAAGGALSQTATNASNAIVEARKISQAFRVAGSAGIGTTVLKLLEAPVTYTDPLLRNFGSGTLNAQGADFCADFRQLTAKYPFTATATTQATPDEVAAMFKPQTGALWTFYSTNLQNVLVRQGKQFVAKPGATPALSPAFVAFFNRAAGVSDALFPGNSTTPHLTLSIKPILQRELSSITIGIDGSTTEFTQQATQPQRFTWTGSASGSADISVQFQGTGLHVLGFQGPWAVFQLFSKADRFTTTGNVSRVEWTVRTAGQPLTLKDGSQVKVVMDLDLGGLPPVLEKNYFAGIRCVSQVAR